MYSLFFYCKHVIVFDNIILTQHYYNILIIIIDHTCLLSRIINCKKAFLFATTYTKKRLILEVNGKDAGKVNIYIGRIYLKYVKRVCLEYLRNLKNVIFLSRKERVR